LARDPLPAQVALDLARRAEALDHAALRVRVREGGEAIHDLRVSCRRLDEALATWEGGLPAKKARELRRTVNTLRRSVGDARDAEVRFDTLRELARRCERPERASALPLLRELSDEIAHARRAAARATREAHVERVVARVHLLAGRIGSAEDKGGALRAAAHAHQAERRDQLRKARALMREGRRGDSARMHAARIKAKKARYVVECLADAGLATSALELDRLRGLQKRLGAACDYVALAEWLGRREERKALSPSSARGRAATARAAARRAWLARARAAHARALHAIRRS